MSACEWILYRSASGTYGCVELGSTRCNCMNQKTIKHCSFFGTESEAKAEVKRRECADGLVIRGGVSAIIGYPAYKRKAL